MKNNWPAIDLLRGIAVIFMLLNHSAVKWIKVDEMSVGLAGILNFIGSFAPVMFFFITGIGYGLAHQIGKPAKTKDVIIKASILIVADVFMRGGDFSSIGWDFLAFIGFSMLLLHCLRGRRFGMLLAFLLIGLFLIARFVLGPIYEALIEQPDYVMQVLLGVSGLKGVSYWFTPWFIYPLAGFIIGHWASTFTAMITKNPINIFLFFTLLGISIAVVSSVLASKGFILFRWGTMSLNFFIASFACICLSIGIAWLISNVLNFTKLTQILSMRGISSLAVVPIHYGIINLIANVTDKKISGELYLLLMPFWLLLCFYLAKETNKLSYYISQNTPSSGMKIMFATVVLLAFICSFNQLFSALFVVTFTAQFILCLLLGFPYIKRSETNKVSLVSDRH
jgi:uncharacterized membrane protein